MVAITGEVEMVEPDLGSFLNTNGVTSIGDYLGDLNVTDDNVGFPVDTEANTDER